MTTFKIEKQIGTNITVRARLPKSSNSFDSATRGCFDHIFKAVWITAVSNACLIQTFHG